MGIIVSWLSNSNKRGQKLFHSELKFSSVKKFLLFSEKKMKGLTLQVFPRPRRRPPLKSLSAIRYRPFNSASEDLESSPMLIMSPTSSSERNKQTMLISDLNNRKVNSEKCKLAEKASNVSAFEVGAVPEPQVTLGSEPTPSS